MTASTEMPQAAERGLPVDHHFRAMGCDLRIAAIPRAGEHAGSAVARATQFVHGAELALSRFDAMSELRQLDASPLQTVTVSRLLALAVDHAYRAAQATGGLLDPTLAPDMEDAGYATSWDQGRRVPLAELLAAAPARQPAQGRREATWRAVQVDRDARTITRPLGLRLDLGATAKGLVADLALRMLGPVDFAIVDIAGDLAIGGDRTHLGPTAVLASDPFGDDPASLSLRTASGIATSSIAGRCWMHEGRPAHHLLNPATGEPAFTGLVQVTAAAPTAAEAELLAGHALLAGPTQAAARIARYGGVLTLDDGTRTVLAGTLLSEGAPA